MRLFSAPHTSLTYDDLHIYYQNVRGLRTKLNTLRLALTETDFDVLVFTETWLDDSIPSSLFTCTNFIIYRCDRNPCNSTHTRGGGVLIACAASLNSTVIRHNYASLELLWVCIKLDCCSLFIGVIYIPPGRSSSDDVIELLHESVSEIYVHMKPVDQLMLFGDFNKPLITWNVTVSSPLHYIPSCSSPTNDSFIDGMSFNGLAQLSGVTNNRGRQLDLIFANATATESCSCVRAVLCPILPLDDHHPALEISVPDMLFEPSSTENLRRTRPSSGFNFSKINYARFTAELTSINWSFIEDAETVDAAVTMFNDKINSIFPLCCPFLNPPPNPPWSNRTLRLLKTEKKRAHRRYHRDRNNSISLRIYKYAANTYRDYNRWRYDSYLVRLQDRFTTDPRSFWRFCNSRRKQNGIPPILSLNDKTASTPYEKCCLFAEHFSSVFVEPGSRGVPLADGLSFTPRDVLSLNHVSLDITSVRQSLSKLKLSFAPGPDGIPSSILKKCPSLFAPLLLRIFNRSVREGSFPTIWKSAWLIPTHKKNDRSVCTNYRGISKLCSPSIVLESIIHSSILPAIVSHISPFQHGFIPKRSTSSNLMCLISFAFNNMVSGHQTDVIYTDFKAAFDSVPLDLLVAKLERLGVGGPLLSWFVSYLYGRTYKVRVLSCYSESFPGSSGVPQGSVLSPLLFLLFINDCTSTLPRDGYLLYADDLKIFLPVSSFLDCCELQNVLNSFSLWCNANGLLLCPDKCCVISFGRSCKFPFSYSLCGTPISRVTSVKDLGVWLDETLNFNLHVDYVVKTANKTLGLITRLSSEITDPRCLRTLYCCWVRSTLEYAAVIWSPPGSVAMARLESVQRKFTRLMVRRFLVGHYAEVPPYPIRCQLLELDSIEVRHSQIRSCFIASLLSHDLDVPCLLSGIPFYAPSRHLRDRPPLHIPSRHTRFASNDPFLRALSDFNSSYHLFDYDLPLSHFRSRLRASPPSISL